MPRPEPTAEYVPELGVGICPVVGVTPGDELRWACCLPPGHEKYWPWHVALGGRHSNDSPAEECRPVVTWYRRDPATYLSTEVEVNTACRDAATAALAATDEYEICEDGTCLRPATADHDWKHCPDHCPDDDED